MADINDGWKWMEVGRPNVSFSAITGHVNVPVSTNSDGWGEFRCLGGKVSVWLESSQQGGIV